MAISYEEGLIFLARAQGYLEAIVDNSGDQNAKRIAKEIGDVLTGKLLERA